MVAVASALFYPPALLINGGIFALWKLGELIRWFFRRGRRVQGKHDETVHELIASPLRKWYVYLLGFSLALLIVWLHSRQVATHPNLGDFLPVETMMKAPEFQGDGRVNISSGFRTPGMNMVRYFLRHNLESPLPNWFERGVLVCCIFFAVWKRKSLGRLGSWLAVFGVVSVIWYFVAREVFPALFLPDRYLAYPWRLWAPLLITFLLTGVWKLYPKTWLAAVLAAVLLGYGYYRQPPEKLPFSSQEGREQIFAALSALPENALIAMPPRLADQVPVFTHRNVFISNESAHALYFEHYHDYVMPRFHDFTLAYSTTGDSLVNVVAFMDKWEIDYLMVDRNQLQNAWYRAWEPHGQLFYDRIKPVPPPKEPFSNCLIALGC